MDSARLIDAELTGVVIGGFYSVYNVLGYGFSEKVYRAALELELDRRGVKASRESEQWVFYRGVAIAKYRIDLLVEGRLIVEIKASRHLVREDHQQLFNYLRATNLQVGLLLHFGPRPEFHRMIWTRDHHERT